jgi:hypothetical protein
MLTSTNCSGEVCEKINEIGLDEDIFSYLKSKSIKLVSLTKIKKRFIECQLGIILNIVRRIPKTHEVYKNTYHLAALLQRYRSDKMHQVDFTVFTLLLALKPFSTAA